MCLKWLVWVEVWLDQIAGFGRCIEGPVDCFYNLNSETKLLWMIG